MAPRDEQIEELLRPSFWSYQTVMLTLLGQQHLDTLLMTTWASLA